MADDEGAVESGAGSAGKTGNGVGKLLLIIGGIMVVEAVGFLLFMPGTAGASADPVVERVEAAAKEKEQEGSAQTSEVEVGEFRVTNTAAAPDVAVHLEFTIHVLTATATANDLMSLLAQHKFLVREAIAVVARRATYKDLGDPDLGCLKRQIKERLTKVLGKAGVEGVIISHFNMYQQ